jgi:hypothetical protein
MDNVLNTGDPLESVPDEPIDDDPFGESRHLMINLIEVARRHRL